MEGQGAGMACGSWGAARNNLAHLSVDLSKKLGGGFSMCNLRNLRRFYLRSRIQQPAAELS